MNGRLIVVSGTGTGIGKTHFSEALLGALARLYGRVAGFKPIETGVDGVSLTDATRLERASTFHVKREGYDFTEGVSPHLAARRAGNPIQVERVVASVMRALREVDLLLVELPGGLFSPLSDEEFNADLARRLRADALLLAAPDRLGVLHDVVASDRAASAVHCRIDGVILVAPEQADLSTGHNAPELRRLVTIPLVVTIPRATVGDLSRGGPIRDLADRLRVTLSQTPAAL